MFLIICIELVEVVQLRVGVGGLRCIMRGGLSGGSGRRRRRRCQDLKGGVYCTWHRCGGGCVSAPNGA